MRLTFLRLSLGVWLAAAGALPAQVAPTPEASFSCGLNAAYIYLNRAGHHDSYANLVHDFVQQKFPDSLLAVKDVLQEHGCMTVGIRADADYFLENKGPAIVYLQLSGYAPKPENHFCYLVSANRQDGVRLLDPIFSIHGVSGMTWDTFRRLYQGVALISYE